MSEKEFNEWKENWLRKKGCPFFTCSKALFKKTCGSSLICGSVFSYKMYKEKKWIKECDVELQEDVNNALPTKICPSCLGSMCIKMNEETGELIGESFCKLMNDFYERQGINIDRHNEKYILSQGVWIIPFIGEEAYLNIANNPEKIKEIMNAEKI